MKGETSRRWRALAAALGLAFLCGLAVAAEPAAAAEKKLVARSWNLCDFKSDLDGQWEGSIVASDGNCYFASSTHSGRTGGMFLKFDPKTQTVTPLCKDITAVCGEDPLVTGPQGKIHSPVVEVDGWLYFGTDQSYFGQPQKFPGGHLIGYELATGKFRDLGAVREGYSNYAAVAGSSKAKCVYIYVVAPGQRNEFSSYLYRFDLPGGEKRVAAELPPGGWDSAVYYMYADEDGNCWLPSPDGVLVKYDPKQDKVEKFADALPTKSPFRFRQWNWSHAIPGQNKAVVTTHNGTKLQIFDPQAKENRFRFVADLGSSDLAVAIAGSTVYYITGGRRPRLKSVDISAAQPVVVDHGLITDQDGRKPLRIPALTADTNGGIYMTGDWFTLPGDVATTRLTSDRRTGKESYPSIDRSERFAFVRLPAAK